MLESKTLTETGTGNSIGEGLDDLGGLSGSGEGLVDLGGLDSIGEGLINLGEPVEETARGSGGGVLRLGLSMIMVRNYRPRRSCRTINLLNSTLNNMHAI